MSNEHIAAQQIDYSTLSARVTRADRAAYKKSGLSSGSNIASFITVGVIIFVIIVLFPYMIEVLKENGLSLEAALPIFWIVVLVSFLWQSVRGTTARRARLYKFAQQNNLQYFVDASDPGYSGMIFDNGHSRKIDDAVRFGDGVEIGNYTYITGGGKNQKTHTWAYAKVKLVRRLPHMVLDAKGNNFWKFTNLSDTLDRSQTLALEGDFNNYFTLYAPKQYERDALYVFTPDVMAAMVDYGKEYDIEIVDDDLFIYNNKHFKLDQSEFYERILTIIGTIKNELLDQTDYYADERIGSRAANIVAPQGQRLKAGFNWMIVVFILIMAYIYIIQPLIFRATYG